MTNHHRDRGNRRANDRIFIELGVAADALPLRPLQRQEKPPRNFAFTTSAIVSSAATRLSRF
jgi:hypothetical protein